MPPLPTSFGNFIILRALGSGGGTSWAVGPTPNGQQLCVLKRPPEDRREEPEYLARFRRAAHLSRRLSHEGLATVFDVGEVAGEPYVCEELVEGHDLAEVMQRCAAESRRIPVAAAVQIICESAQALAYLHDFEGLHLAHRKLRPSKIRLTYAGGVKVLDLASGRVAGAEALLRPAILGETLPYLAPEQLGDGPIDARADLYALGAILWECLAGCSLLSTIDGGQASLGGIPREQVAQKILAHQPPPPSRMNPEVRPEVDALVMRALARSPDSRLPTAHGLELALAPLAGPGGRDAVVRLMSRLFDASREREERAALLAESSGRAPRVSHAELPALRSEAPEAPRKRKTGRSLTPIPREPTGLGMASVPSATALVSRNARWLKRFALIFAPVLAAAILFNILMTRRLESQWAAQAAPVPAEAPVVAPPVTSPTAAPLPTPAQAPAPTPAAVHGATPTAPAAAQAPKAEPQPLATAPTGTAPNLPGKAAILPPGSTRPQAEPGRRSSVPSPEAKKALDEARAAFEGDDFTHAIKKGREALELGEGRAHAILGAAYYKVGRFDEAVRAYKEALRLDPRNPTLEKRVELARRAASGHSEAETP